VTAVTSVDSSGLFDAAVAAVSSVIPANEPSPSAGTASHAGPNGPSAISASISVVIGVKVVRAAIHVGVGTQRTGGAFDRGWDAVSVVVRIEIVRHALHVGVRTAARDWALDRVRNAVAVRVVIEPVRDPISIEIAFAFAIIGDPVSIRIDGCVTTRHRRSGVATSVDAGVIAHASSAARRTTCDRNKEREAHK